MEGSFDNHLFIPLVMLLVGATLAAMLRHRRPVARGITALSLGGHTAYSFWLVVRVVLDGRQVTQAGNWQAPYGISLVVDGLSALLLACSSLLVLTLLVFSFVVLDREHEHYFFYPLLLVLLGGVSGIFMTGDLFNLYVWSEVVLMASVGLLTLGGTREQVEGGLKYAVLSAVGSMLVLVGCALLYGVAGTFNMAHISKQLALLESPGFVTVLASLFLVAYAIKSAMFPVFSWLPASYHTPPVVVAALFSGLLTHVGIYTIYRLFTLIFPRQLEILSPLLLLLAALTMVVGGVGAMVQTNIRRMLSFASLTQSGYMLLGPVLVAVAGFEAMAAGIFFIIHAMVAGMALFLLGGLAEHISGTGDMRHMGGVANHSPLLALLWFVAAVALVGVPPLSGFIGKLALLRVALSSSAYVEAGVVVVGFFCNLLPMLRAWNQIFWKPRPSRRRASTLPARATLAMVGPGAVLVGLGVLLALAASFVIDYSLLAAIQALDAAGYVRDVLPELEL